jgi:hypothetical protein
VQVSHGALTNLEFGDGEVDLAGMLAQMVDGAEGNLFPAQGHAGGIGLESLMAELQNLQETDSEADGPGSDDDDDFYGVSDEEGPEALVLAPQDPEPDEASNELG